MKHLLLIALLWPSLAFGGWAQLPGPACPYGTTGGGCAGGTDGTLIAGTAVSTQASCFDRTLDCTTNGIFVYSLQTPDEDGTVSYAHFDSYDCANGVRSAVFTLDGSNVTTRVTGCDSTLADGTDAKPESWDLSIPGECCLVSGTTYAVGIWCESDGDAYNGAYIGEATSPTYTVGMNTFGTSWDHDSAETAHATRILMISLDNTP